MHFHQNLEDFFFQEVFLGWDSKIMSDVIFSNITSLSACGGQWVLNKVQNVLSYVMLCGHNKIKK